MTDIDDERERLFGDRNVGANVAVLRGSMPQKELADKMREYGTKWSQATVHEVEQGRRSLKAKEARYLAEIFGVSSTLIIGDVQGVQIAKTTSDYGHRLQSLRLEILQAITEYETLRDEARQWAEQLIEATTDTRPDISIQFELPKLLETATMSTPDALQQEAQRFNDAADEFSRTGVHTISLPYLEVFYGVDSETS